MRLSQEDERRRNGRNRAIGIALAAFVILVFVGSIVKMSETGEVPMMNVEIGR